MAIDPARLFAQLLNTGLQNKDTPLYQLLSQMIQLLDRLNTDSATNVITGDIANQSFLTVNNDLATLPNSRKSLAGAYVAFDDAVFGLRTVSAAEWSILTNGDSINPELIYASGDVIMIPTP